MALENFKPIEEIEYKISGPIKLTDENHEELMNRCLQMLNKFAPESATRSFFTERTGDEFVVLIEGTDSKTKETKIYGASGFKISTPLARNTTEGLQPVKVLYRSFTYIDTSVRGAGYYSQIQEQVQKVAKNEKAEYQVLRTQNGRVWETAQKSFPENTTFPNPNTDVPDEVQRIAQFYNKNTDGTDKPIDGLVAYTPFYTQLDKVERSCRNPENTKFLEEIFAHGHAFFQERGLVSKDAKFEGIESTHPYSIMVVSKYQNIEEE